MSTWRCPHCEAVLREGKSGPARVTYRPRENPDGSQRTTRWGKPMWMAYCAACGKVTHD